MNLSFSELRHANERRAVLWSGNKPTSLEFSTIELAGKVGEACNAIKKLLRHRLGMAGGRDDIEVVRQELADVVICVDLVARQLDIDLGQAIAEKFNATSQKHRFAVLLPEGVA